MPSSAPQARYPLQAVLALSAIVAGLHAALWGRVDAGLNLTLLLPHLFVVCVGAHYWRVLSSAAFAGFVATVAGLFFLLIAFKQQAMFYAAFLPVIVASYRRPWLCGAVVLLVLCLALITPYWLQTYLLLLLAYVAALRLAQERAGAAVWVLWALGMPLLMLLAFPIVTAVLDVPAQTLWQRLRTPRMANALWTSLWTATTATAIATLLGVPLAYILARVAFKGRALVDCLVDLPILIPQTVAGVALMNCFSQKAALGKWIDSVFGIQFAGTHWGIVLAQVFVAAPFVIRSSAVGFAGVDARLERAARSLGAPSWAVLGRISLPLALPAIAAGALMTWARALSEFGSLLILAYHPMTVPVLVYDNLSKYGLAEANPAAALLLILCLWLFLVVRWIAWLRGRRGGSFLGAIVLSRGALGGQT